MRRPFTTKLLAAGLALGTLHLLSCADNDSMLFVRGVLSWPIGSECLLTAEPANPMRLGGTLDLALRGGGYRAPLLIGNQLTARGSRDQLRTESNRVALRGAVVKVTDPQGRTIVEYTDRNVTGFVDAAIGETPGYGIMSAQILPVGWNQEGTFNTSVRVFGDTLGGEEVESNELTYPVTVCRGCLIAFPAAAIVSNNNVLECGGDEDPTAGVPCEVGQDDYMDCRYCNGALEACKRPGG
jgi:hypothetical protein